MPRPLPTFYDFVGQRRPIHHLSRQIEGAKTLEQPCPSMLLVAPSGYGKTDFANAVATAMGTRLHPLFAGRDVTPDQMCAALYALNFADILFVDEAHSLKEDSQQVLFVALDQHKIPMPGKRGLNRAELMSIAAFTVVLATNEPGKLKDGLRKRLIRVEFDAYSVAELRHIALRLAQAHGIDLTSQAARRLAEAAQGVPRYVCQRLSSLQRHYPLLKSFQQQHVEELLAAEGVDAHGLWPMQRRYMRFLADSPNGACSLERLAASFGLDAAYIRQEIEPFLFHQGLVDATGRRGRALTKAGRAIVAELIAAQASDQHDEEVAI